MHIAHRFTFLYLLMLCTGCGYTFAPDIPEHVILIDDIDEEISSFMRSNPGHGSFLVFLTGHAGDDGAPSFAQISIERDEIGIDHVMNTQAHRLLEARFMEFAKAQNLEVVDRTMNDVRYLRMPHSEPAAIVKEVLIYVQGLQSKSEVLVFGELENAT